MDTVIPQLYRNQYFSYPTTDMKRFLLACAAMVVCAAGVMAQSHVKWRTSVKMTSPTEGVVTVRAIIDAGWHLYGTQLPPDGPRPTRLDFSGSEGVALTGKLSAAPAPVHAMDEAFGAELSWWEGRVAFTQRFRVTDRSKANIKIAVSYMCCNGANCAPPRTDSITATVPEFKPASTPQ